VLAKNAESCGVTQILICERPESVPL